MPGYPSAILVMPPMRVLTVPSGYQASLNHTALENESKMSRKILILFLLAVLPSLKPGAADFQGNLGITLFRPYTSFTDPYYYDMYYSWIKVFSLHGSFISSTDRAFQQEIGLGVNFISSFYQLYPGFSIVNYSWFTFIDSGNGLYRIGIEYSPYFWLPSLEIMLRLGVAVSLPLVSIHPQRRHELIFELGFYPFSFSYEYGLYPVFWPFVAMGWNIRWTKESPFR
jgi:hypothetical protein